MKNEPGADGVISATEQALRLLRLDRAMRQCSGDSGTGRRCAHQRRRGRDRAVGGATGNPQCDRIWCPSAPPAPVGTADARRSSDGDLTDGARAAAEVAEHVRWPGTPHAAAQQWKATGTYGLFDDPMATRWCIRWPPAADQRCSAAPAAKSATVVQISSTICGWLKSRCES